MEFGAAGGGTGNQQLRASLTPLARIGPGQVGKHRWSRLKLCPGRADYWAMPPSGINRRCPAGPLSDSTLSRLLKALPDAVIIVDGEGHLQWANEVAEGLFGRTLESSIGLSGLELVHPEDLEFVLRSLVSIQGKENGTPIEVRLRTASGWRLMELIGAPITWFRSGAVLLSIRDLTDRRRYELSHDEDSRFRSLVHNAAVLTMLVSPSGVVQSCSGALTRLLGHDSELVEGKPLENLTPVEDRRALRAALRRASAGALTANPVTVTISLLRYGTNAPVPFELSFVNLIDDPTVNGYVVSGHDVTERRRLEEQLSYQAFHDSLTGLANRHFFHDRLQQALALADRTGRTFALLFLDLDDFKQVNDDFGHAGGDWLLQTVAQRLAGCLRDMDTAARLGGDEFGVLAEGLVYRGGATVLARRILRACHQPVIVGDQNVSLGLSIGISLNTPGISIEQMLHNADRAMYTAKHNGKNRYETYEDEVGIVSDASR